MMDRRFAIAAAALAASTGLCNLSAFGQAPEPAVPAPATHPATGQADIPVKQVVLFSSGVGYFEHGGTVTGDAAAELRFKTEQVNDVLKSLLLQDMDGGVVGAVSYPGLAPLAHTLKTFQIDITANPDMADLLNQLRGAKLTISMGANQKMTGVILGVEKKLRADGEKAVVESVKLNLKVDRQFHSINLERIDSMELEDPTLQKELDQALAALAQSRDQDKKPMTLHFHGKGERHVRIGYLVETPIWKTSYRLMLGNPGAGKKVPPEQAARPATAPADAAGAVHPAKLQGWAIVENQTDNDWHDVQLSLVSGQPLSFIQDLYHSQYLPRPVVQADNYASLRPQTYGGGIANITDLVTNVPDFTDAPDFSLNSASNNQKQTPQADRDMGGGKGKFNGLFGSGSGGGGFMDGQQATEQKQPQAPIDPTASIISAAKAAKVGALFKYHVGNVAIARQSSAMIPIITDDIDAQRVSIFNAAVLPTHPLLGAWIRNNTGKYLLQGPITVLDQGSYAGDARLADLPPGQERLVSFGIDQEVTMDASEIKQQSASVTAKIVKGVLTLTCRDIMEQTYLADNQSDDSRLLVVEHPRHAGFNLVSPATAEETTAELFRFRRTIAPHKTAKMTVRQEHVFDKLAQIIPLSPADLAAYLKDGAIPQNVRDAIAKAVVMKNQLTALKARLDNLDHQKQDFVADQSRIRENLKAVAAESDYYKRLMKKIDAEENDIEKVQNSILETVEKFDEAEKQMSDYVTGLTVG